MYIAAIHSFIQSAGRYPFLYIIHCTSLIHIHLLDVLSILQGIISLYIHPVPSIAYSLHPHMLNSRNQPAINSARVEPFGPVYFP